MAEIVTPDEIKAVGDLTGEFNKLGNVLDDIIKKGEDNQTVVKQAKSIKELIGNVDKLREEEKKLTDTNKKLKDTQDKAARSAKNQADAMDALDDNMGGVITRTKEMGKQFLALMKNPFILALVAIVGTLAAMAHAMKTFVTTTGEGEDMLNRQKGVWNSFFSVIKDGWKDMGKSFVEALGEDGLQGLLFSILAMFSPKMAAVFLKTSEEAKSLADTIDDIETRMAINITRRAQTELRFNKLANEAEKLKYANQVKAVKLLEESTKVKEEQMRIDKELAKGQADATLYQIGLEHNLTKAEVDRMNHAQRDAEFTGEEMKKIAEAYAKVIDLESRYEQEVKRNTTKIIAFKEQIRTAAVKAAQDAATAEIQAAKNIEEKAIANIKNRAVAGAISVQEAEKQIMEFRKTASEAYVNTQIEALSKVLLVEELNAQERAAVEQKLFDLKNDLVDVYFQNIEEKTKISLEDIVAIYMDFSTSLNDLFASITEKRLQQIDQEEKRLEEFYATRITMAGDNEERVSEIENEAERRRIALENKRIQAQRRAAVFDKAVSASQAAIQTSLAIIRMLANPGGPVGVGMSIAAGITGALQVAAILAKPIPQYKDGGITTNPFVIAGEEGIERFTTPDGKVGYTPPQATLMQFPIGTKIDNHNETMRDLASGGLNNIGGTRGTADDVSWALYRKLGSVEEAIKNKRETHYNWTRKGLEKAFKNGQSREYFMNNFYN